MTRERRFAGIAAMAAIMMCALPLWAQREEVSKMAIHGYLSQAYARSDGHQILGIGDEGTSEYRDLALQFRYEQSPRSTFVIQLSHERLGDSPVSALKDDMELDWAFYERRLTDALAIKVGRIPIPLGIYNESRDAGTTFPFYRPATGFYGEGQYTNETVEGAVLASSFPAMQSWRIEADVYYGQWRFIQEDFQTEAEARDAIGGQVWVNTPIIGLRFGGGFYRATVGNLLYRPDGAKAVYQASHGSVEADFDRWSVALEALEVDADLGRYRSVYAQAGIQLDERWSIHGRLEHSALSLTAGRIVIDRRLDRDLAIGVNYSLAPSVLLKLEGHSNAGLLVEDVDVDITDPDYRTRYAIISLAASF